MPGLVPGIHVSCGRKTWMAGTGPAMTQSEAASPADDGYHTRIGIST